MNEDIIARWVAAEMVAEGVVTRKDDVLIVSASGRDFMIEVKAYEVTEPQTAVKILTESGEDNG